MQIQKINNNKVKVILNASDLIKKNIDIESFLSNSEEYQNFFFEILDMIETKYSFDIEDKKAIVEAISLDNNIFVLTITKIENDITKDILNSDTSIYVFSSLKNIFELYYSVTTKKINFKNLYIYEFLDCFYVFTEQNKDTINNLLIEYSSYKISNFLKDIILEHGKRVSFI